METIKHVKNNYIHAIGVEFTDFVGEYLEKLEFMYKKVKMKDRKAMPFPTFCYCVYANFKTEVYEKTV
jgi:hypothetical protein